LTTNDRLGVSCGDIDLADRDIGDRETDILDIKSLSSSSNPLSDKSLYSSDNLLFCAFLSDIDCFILFLSTFEAFAVASILSDVFFLASFIVSFSLQTSIYTSIA
jgi:hypothetical protein